KTEVYLIEELLIKLKITRSVNTIIETIKNFVKTIPNYIFVATIEGDWNIIIVMRVEEPGKNPTSKIIEKFSDQILDYKINSIKINDVNLLNMSLLLLT